MMTALLGHISHLYEDHNLRFLDIKAILSDIAKKNIKCYEKIDGQNLVVCWNFDKDELITARNQSNIKQGGLNRYGLQLKFGDRPEIEATFVEAYDEINKVIKEQFSYNDKVKVFGSMGNIWHSLEVVNPSFYNTIKYDNKAIVWHDGAVLFGIDGKPLQINIFRNSQLLYEMLPALKTEKYTFLSPCDIEISNILPGELEYYKSQIESICKKAKISETDTIKFYLFKRIMQDMVRFPTIPHGLQAKIAKSLCGYRTEEPVGNVIGKLDKILKIHALDVVREEKKVIRNLLKPLEKIIDNFYHKITKGITSCLVENPSKEMQRIKLEYSKSIGDIKSDENDNIGKEILEKYKDKLSCDQICLEGLTFFYKEQIYKMTGNFAHINRICAHKKYKNYKRQKNKKDDCLIGSFTVG